MIERRADWKRAEQSDARFFPTVSSSAAGERRAGRPSLHPRPSRYRLGEARAGVAIPP